jgi:general secretion pathway protein M
MEQSSQKVKMSRALNLNTTQYSGNDPAPSLISKTAKARGLGSGGINRMEPDGERGTRVWIEGVIFDDMLSWIALLQQNFGLTVVEIIIDKAKDPGFVNIQVLFREGRHDEP